MNDCDNPYSQPAGRSVSQPLGNYTPTPPHRGQRNVTDGSSPFLKHPSALESSVSITPSIFITPESAFNPEIATNRQIALDNFRAYLNAKRAEPVTENNVTLLNYLKSYDWDIEAASENYDARVERIRRTRASPEESAEFIRCFNTRLGAPGSPSNIS